MQAAETKNAKAHLSCNTKEQEKVVCQSCYSEVSRSKAKLCGGTWLQSNLLLLKAMRETGLEPESPSELHQEELTECHQSFILASCDTNLIDLFN